MAEFVKMISFYEITLQRLTAFLLEKTTFSFNDIGENNYCLIFTTILRFSFEVLLKASYHRYGQLLWVF